MVITMASFLVVAGYNKEQMAAALGLLGTIAGYLLGQGSASLVAERIERERREALPDEPGDARKCLSAQPNPVVFNRYSTAIQPPKVNASL